MNKNKIEIFKNASIPKAAMTNIIPSIISMIMVLVYNLADTFFIGQTHNPYMVAGVSLATPFFMLFLAIGLLFGIGGTSLISRLFGEEKGDKAKNVSSFCFWSGLVIGLISMVFIWIAIEPICVMLGAENDTIAYVRQYLQIVAVGVPFLIVSNSFSNIIRAEGKANTAMMGMILGNLLNIVLDPIMILVFNWNIAGAAIATVLGNIAAIVFYIFHLVSKNSMLSINIKDYKIKDRIARGVLEIGIPSSLNNVLMSISGIVINNFMSRFGAMAIAGLGVAMKINMMAVMPLIGVGTGIQPLLGYCYGAGNKNRFKGALKFALFFVLTLGIIMTAISYFLAGPIVNAFLEEKSAYSYGIMFARILIISGPVLGVMFVFNNAIQAIGAAVPALIMSISRQGLVYIPLLLIFHNLFNKAEMIVAAQPVADYLAFFLSIILFIFSFRKYLSNDKFKKQLN